MSNVPAALRLACAALALAAVCAHASPRRSASCPPSPAAAST
ncbi:hypothetical protein ACU4GD_22010 [Cupriavidus basilensis]